MMRLADILAIAFLIASMAAFVLGDGALARSDDLRSGYWLGIGMASLWAGVQVARPRVKP
jgi:hypothetical protein